MRQLLIVEAQVESRGSLGFVVHEVVVTDHTRHDMAFVSGFEPQKTLKKCGIDLRWQVPWSLQILYEDRDFLNSLIILLYFLAK